jgi:hypothetical protein
MALDHVPTFGTSVLVPAGRFKIKTDSQSQLGFISNIQFFPFKKKGLLRACQLNTAHLLLFFAASVKVASPAEPVVARLAATMVMAGGLSQEGFS